MKTEQNHVAIAAAAADWWAERFGVKDARPQFRDEIRMRVLVGLRNGRRLTLYCEYDPLDDLLSAVRAAGVSCRGDFFSGDDLGMPRKTGLFVTESGEVLTKEGYGAESVPLVIPSSKCQQP